MDRRTQDELLEILDVLRQQVQGGFIVPVGSVRYHPSAVVISGYVYPLELTARLFADSETGHADLASPSVLVYYGVLAENAQLRAGVIPVLEHLKSKPHRALALFALDVDGIVLEALANAHQRKVCAVAPIGCAGMTKEEAGHYLRAIARMCGATALGPTARDGQAWVSALGGAGRILTDRRRVVISEPARADQAEFSAQPVGLLSVGGNDARDVIEGVEWLEGLLGH